MEKYHKLILFYIVFNFFFKWNFFFLNEKVYKNNFYIDYFFKNFIFFIYKSVFGNNFLYFIDKYLTETLISSITQFLSYLFIVNNTLKYLNFNKIIQIMLIVVVQVILIFIL